MPSLSKFSHSCAARVVAAALIAAAGLVMAASMWEPLHEWLHGEGHGSDHECAITLYATGSCDAVFPREFVCIATFAAAVDIVVSRDAWVPSIFLMTRVWEHAPPRGS